jgi:hypothetical protein
MSVAAASTKKARAPRSAPLVITRRGPVRSIQRPMTGVAKADASSAVENAPATWAGDVRRSRAIGAMSTANA